MLRKSVAVGVIWYFLMSGVGGGMMRKGPFTGRVACETYRMRVARFAKTSACIAVTKKK
jgi:hypothetical protein